MNHLQQMLWQQEQVSGVHTCYYTLPKPPQALQYEALHAQVLSTAWQEFDQQTFDLRMLLQHQQDKANTLYNSLAVSCISKDIWMCAYCRLGSSPETSCALETNVAGKSKAWGGITESQEAIGSKWIYKTVACLYWCACHYLEQYEITVRQHAQRFKCKLWKCTPAAQPWDGGKISWDGTAATSRAWQEVEGNEGAWII